MSVVHKQSNSVATEFARTILSFSFLSKGQAQFFRKVAGTKLSLCLVSHSLLQLFWLLESIEKQTVFFSSPSNSNKLELIFFSSPITSSTVVFITIPAFFLLTHKLDLKRQSLHIFLINQCFFKIQFGY